MRLISAEYDAYNRKFKLLNSADAGRLRDGETYLFMAFSEEDLTQIREVLDFAARSLEASSDRRPPLNWFAPKLNEPRITRITRI